MLWDSVSSFLQSYGTTLWHSYLLYFGAIKIYPIYKQIYEHFFCHFIQILLWCRIITLSIPFQGNGATSVSWLIISVVLIMHLRFKALLSQHFVPICWSIFNLAALLHVDNTDLNVLNFSNKSIFGVIAES